jgi:hypothetical protein
MHRLYYPNAAVSRLRFEKEPVAGLKFFHVSSFSTCWSRAPVLVQPGRLLLWW